MINLSLWEKKMLLQIIRPRSLTTIIFFLFFHKTKKRTTTTNIHTTTQTKEQKKKEKKIFLLNIFTTGGYGTGINIRIVGGGDGQGMWDVAELRGLRRKDGRRMMDLIIFSCWLFYLTWYYTSSSSYYNNFYSSSNNQNKKTI